MRREVVSIIYRHLRILLGMKKKKFGVGRYNGFGGGIEPGEGATDTAVRETLEEAGIKIINPEEMGRILFNFESNEQDHLVHFFRSRKYLGNPRESDEMISRWFNINEIPYDKMWADDKYWLPLLLDGKKFKGNFLFSEDHKIVRYRLDEIVKLG